MTDLLGGRIDFVAADLGAVLPQIRARNLNAVALVSAKRSTILSSVPTAGTWHGKPGPDRLDRRGRPAPDAGSGGMVVRPTATLREPAVQERLRAIGMEPDLIVGEPLQQFVRAQYEAWGQQIRDAGIQPE